MDRKITNGFLFASLAAFFMVSVSLVLMAFGGGSQPDNKRTLSIICGIVFWLFLALGIAFQVILTRYVKAWRSKTYKIRRYLRINPQIGIISFFRNPPGLVSDIIFVLSLLTFIISYLLTDGVSIICYISFSLMFLSFCTHCIFNGKNYYYIVNHQSIEEHYNKNMEELR